MSPEVRDAIESATSVEVDKTLVIAPVKPRRKHGFGEVRAIVLAVAQELPSEMTMAELCDELANANNQGTADQ